MSRYRRILQSATEFAVIVTDRDGMVTEWNTGAERVLGWLAREMVGRHASLFFTPEDRATDRISKEMADALLKGRGVDERWHMKNDGTRFWASGEMMPLREEDGTHIGFVKILRDRTEQHLAGVRLEELQTQLDQAQEAGGVGLFTVEISSGMLSPTPEFSRLYGHEHREIRPTEDFERLVVPEDRHLVSSDATRRAAEAPPVVEYRIRRADTGELRRIARKGDFQYNSDGRPVRFVGIARDVTDESEADDRRDAILALGDMLRDLDDLRSITSAAARTAGRMLRASRACFGFVDDIRETTELQPNWCAPGVASVEGTYAFRDYGSYVDDLKRNIPVTILDVAADPRTADHAAAFASLGIRTLVNMPILARGRLVAVLAVHYAERHGWTATDTAFLRDVADRTQFAVTRVQAEESRAVLNRELAHRLKNTLAIVQAIATQTLRVAPDMATARKTLTERIGVLSRAHEMLLTGQRDAASLEDIVKAATALHDQSGRVRVKGPHVPLGPKASLTLSLIVHELSTNAGKYGALSSDEGHVDVAWTVAPDEASGRPLLVFDWRETGGPPVTAPTQTSFGTRLIEMGMSGSAEGSSELHYAPDGVRCRITASLTELRDDDEPGGF